MKIFLGAEQAAVLLVAPTSPQSVIQGDKLLFFHLHSLASNFLAGNISKSKKSTVCSDTNVLDVHAVFQCEKERRNKEFCVYIYLLCVGSVYPPQQAW